MSYVIRWWVTLPPQLPLLRQLPLLLIPTTKLIQQTLVTPQMAGDRTDKLNSEYHGNLWDDIQ